jgi:drug/metabolite transporter (DMT)-like permease
LLPFTYKEISKIKVEVKNNLSLFFILGFTSVGIFSAFTYNALNYTQVINASLFNTAIPVSIILVCFLLKIEKTNIFQISGLIVSVLGILAIITRLDLNILLTLNFNKGDIYMVIAIISWGIYSAFLKKNTFDISLLSLVHVVCTFGLIILLPTFLFELAQGKITEINSNLIFILLYIAIFPSIGSYYCWAGAVSIIGANRAGIFLSLIPLFSTIFAMIFFNEKFLFFHFIGSVLIILGLFLSNKKVRNA